MPGIWADLSKPMKTHLLTSPTARSRFTCLLFQLLLLPAAVPLARAQQSELVQPEPIPDANGKIPYVPSPFPGIPIERRDAYTRTLKTLTPEFLRALPDDSQLLADLFRFEAASPPGRSPENDMIEMEMWRRGDVAIEIIKKAFEHPATEDTPISIVIWLRYRPWMKPEEFLPLARRWYEINSIKRPGYTHGYASQRVMVEFLAWWGESEDETLIKSYYKGYEGERPQFDFLMRKFKERQELRAKGNPRGMPEWFFEPERKMQKHTAIPISDCTKTYKEKKAEQAK